MARILLIDDEHLIRDLIAEILVDAGHDVLASETARDALERLDDFDAEIVVSDIVMPDVSGLQLLSAVRERRPSLPVLLITGAGTHAMLSQALAGGADGLVMKPFSHDELVGAVSAALERSRRTERELRDRLLTPSLASALANAIEARDSTMQGHCERMSQLAVRIGLELGLADYEVETIRLGAILHDVGKIGIPDRVLAKHGAFGEDERVLMETHPLIGDELLASLELLAAVRPVVRHHHERWDGTGYPDRLGGDGIPLAARVVALADSVEAMSGERTYRVPLTRDAIVRELQEGSGNQWEPRLVDIVLDLIRSGALSFTETGLVLSETTEEVERSRAVAVLLVEDDQLHAMMAKSAIEKAIGNAVVTHAPNAASALDLCRGASFSLIVLDHNLPDGSGVDLVETLHTLAPDVPVVMLTGEGSETVAIEAFRHGVADYVVKSKGFLEELTGRVRALVAA